MPSAERRLHETAKRDGGDELNGSRAHRRQSERALADGLRPCAFALVVALAATAPVAGQLVLAGNHRIFQNEVGGVEEPGDRFGAALIAGDFNRDGYADLAIGAPGEDLGADLGAGAVYVVYGSAAGLGESQTSPLVLHQDVAGVGGVAATGDRFGEALAAADVNGDGWDDLAVGVPGEDILFGNEGALQVFLSSVGGVVAAADTYIVPNDFYGGTYGLHGSAAFGSALAACDLDGDGWEDLLVGAPDWRDNEPFSEDDLGYVLLLPGSPSGTRVDWAESFTTWEQDRFGAAVDCRRAESTGEFHVLVGAPRSSDFPGSEPGAVFALLDGEFVDSDQGEQAEARYGERVAWGDFAGLGEPQSIAGAPGWDFPGPIGEGGLVLVRELGGTLSTSFSQDSSGIADHVEGFDHFGAALAVADFNRDGYDDAVISAPDENLNDGPETKFDVGVVHVLFGGSGGLSGSAAQYWHWDSIGFGALAYDQFGAALAVGDFDGNGVDDLAIGAPGAEWSGQADTGIVEILYAWPDGWIFGDDFEGGNTQKWSL